MESIIGKHANIIINIKSAAVAVQIQSGPERQGCPGTKAMADSKMEDESAMELLGNLDYLGGETRKDRKRRSRE
eukprot:6135148-Heterocapsa_arctica.AAC.1